MISHQSDHDLLELLEGMVAGSADLVDGCRTLAQLRNSGDERIPMDFVTFDSELDRVPLLESRHLWSEAALAEAMTILNAYRGSIIFEAGDLLQRLKAAD